MKLYKVIKNGIETNGWTSDSGKDETHYEPGFGKPERWVRANDGEDVSQAIETRFYEVEPARPAVYEDQVVTIPPVVDEQGNEVEAAREETVQVLIDPGAPAVMGLEYKLPAEFEIVVEDITEKLAQAEKLALARKAQDKGAEIIAAVWAINDSKQVSPEQLVVLIQDPQLQMVERLLWTGALQTAKVLIQGYDNPLFTAEEKAKILQMFD